MASSDFGDSDDGFSDDLSPSHQLGRFPDADPSLASLLEVLVAAYDVAAEGQAACEHGRALGIAYQSPSFFDRISINLRLDPLDRERPAGEFHLCVGATENLSKDPLEFRADRHGCAQGEPHFRSRIQDRSRRQPPWRPSPAH